MPSPAAASSTSIVQQSSSLSINALISGDKWGGAGGTGATVSFSFPWTTAEGATFAGHNDYAASAYSQLNEPNATYHYGLNTTQQAAARAALQAWADVADITFQEVRESTSNVGDIRLAWTSAGMSTTANGPAWGWASYPDDYWPSGGDIWLSTALPETAANPWTSGSYNFQALLHETGHALGLKHPFEDAPILPLVLDNELHTVMSYTDAPHNLYPAAGYVNGVYDWLTYSIEVETPMILDIAAIQYLYGANNSYRTGNDTYTFDSARPFFKTLWDAGGIDTLSAANFTQPCLIDLTPGNYSSLKYPPPTNTGGVTPTYDGTGNLGIAFGCIIENAIGGTGNDTLIGNAVGNELSGGAGNDTLDGGAGSDVALFSGNLASYTLSRSGGSYTVRANSGSDGTDSVSGIESLRFADKTVNLTVQGKAAAAPQADVQRLSELYVAFFNRVPDADGLAYWIDQMSAGQQVNQIAESFYNAGVQYSSLTGFSSGMSNGDFVNVIYRNVLGRTTGADADGLAYWSGELASGRASHGSLVSTMLASAHTFKGDATWGWVANLLDNKITVANRFAIDWGLNYNTPGDSIAQGMAIAAAVTPTDTAQAIALIGVSATDISLG